MKREKCEKGKIISQKLKLPLVHGNCNEETAIKILKGQILSPSLSKKCRLLGKSLQKNPSFIKMEPEKTLFDHFPKFP